MLDLGFPCIWSIHNTSPGMVQMGRIQIFPSDFSVAALDVHSGVYPVSHFPPQIYTVAITNRK